MIFFAILFSLTTTPLFGAQPADESTPSSLSQRIFQAMVDDYDDHSHPDSSVTAEVRLRYQKDLLLVDGLLENAQNSLDVFNEIVALVNKPYYYVGKAHRNEISEYKRTGTGASHRTDQIIEGFRKAIKRTTPASRRPQLLDNLFQLMFHSPHNYGLAELLMGAISNPDFFYEIKLSQTSDIKGFLILMTLHPSSQVRAWAVMGLGYFANDPVVQNLLVQINSQSKIELQFTSGTLKKLEEQIKAHSETSVFQNLAQTKTWLDLFSQVYRRWHANQFESKIDDFFDYDREYAVIKTAGSALLWHALPNKDQFFTGDGESVYVRAGLPLSSLFHFTEAPDSRIENPPQGKPELSLENIWIMMDMPVEKMRSGFAKMRETLGRTTTTYGTRHTVVAFLKYKLLGLEPPDAFLFELGNHLSTIQNKHRQGQLPLDNQQNIEFAGSSGQLLTLLNDHKPAPPTPRTRLFAARALALFGEKEIAAGVLERLFKDELLTPDQIPEWREGVLLTFGNAEGRRMIISWINQSPVNGKTCAQFLSFK